jgi:hypothetical protein
VSFSRGIDCSVGYRFRDLPRNNGTTPVAVTENLKSPEELENEDREAQSAVCIPVTWMSVLTESCI